MRFLLSTSASNFPGSSIGRLDPDDLTLVRVGVNKIHSVVGIAWKLRVSQILIVAPESVRNLNVGFVIVNVKTGLWF